MITKAALFFGLKKSISKSDVCAVLNVLTRHGCRVSVDSRFACPEYSAFDGVEYTEKNELFTEAELAVVMGGDGSIIEAARRSAGLSVPIIGINFGTLGYLAELEFGEIDMLEQVLDGDFKIEERMMLDFGIVRGGETVKSEKPCLNDIVLSNGPVSRLSGFDLYCDGIYVARYAADGVIISTPTGSSAYSMSAGGPLIYQTMECICATPICPHSLTLKPVIFKGDAVLEIRNASCRENSMFITADGRSNIEVFSDDVITIKKSDTSTRLVRVKNGGFMSVLHRKLSDSYGRNSLK